MALADADAKVLVSVQVNIPAESGEMGILAQHVPSIEQLKPGLVEIIEESGGSKQFFRTFGPPEAGGLGSRLSNRWLASVWRLRDCSAEFTIEHQRC